MGKDSTRRAPKSVLLKVASINAAALAKKKTD